MDMSVQAIITHAEDRPRDTWNDPTKGDIAWHTLFSADITPTDGMCAGIAVLAPGGVHRRHRHAEPELYFIHKGSGTLTIANEETIVSTGAAIFIAGNAWHSLHNTGEEEIRIFYAFPTARFSDIVYEFPA